MVVGETAKRIVGGARVLTVKLAVPLEVGDTIYEGIAAAEAEVLPDDDEILLLRRATYGLSYATRTSPTG